MNEVVDQPNWIFSCYMPLKVFRAEAPPAFETAQMKREHSWRKNSPPGVSLRKKKADMMI